MLLPIPYAEMFMPLSSESLAISFVGDAATPPFTNVVSPRYSFITGGVLSGGAAGSLKPILNPFEKPEASRC
jgi:hypothetical protein